MKKYKIAFLGMGKVFSKHLKALKKNNFFSIYGAYDKKKINLEFSKNKNDIFNSKDTDIVALLTPSGNHFEETKKNIIAI